MLVSNKESPPNTFKLVFSVFLKLPTFAFVIGPSRCVHFVTVGKRPLSQMYFLLKCFLLGCDNELSCFGQKATALQS